MEQMGLPYVATVLTVYGIETQNPLIFYIQILFWVATVLTVYGIETGRTNSPLASTTSLQQSLPFTVLKL